MSKELEEDDQQLLLSVSASTHTQQDAGPPRSPLLTPSVRRAVKFLGPGFSGEVLATFVLMCFGLGADAQSTLSRGNFGHFLSVNFGWGLGVMVGCYAAGGMSGAHMNPAVSLAMAFHRRLPWKQLPVYILAQFLGSFLASALVYFVYYDAVTSFGAKEVTGENGTAGIWATYPQDFLSIGSGFLDQVVGTGLLLLGVFAIVDANNWSPGNGAKPMALGALVFAIGVSFGFNCGYAINPARDFAPRVFTAIAGWGKEVFTAGSSFWWIPIIATCLGGVMGSSLYVLLIEAHHPTASRQPLE